MEKLKENEKRDPAVTYIRKELYAYIKIKAKEHDVSISAFMEHILEEYKSNNPLPKTTSSPQPSSQPSSPQPSQQESPMPQTTEYPEQL